MRTYVGVQGALQVVLAGLIVAQMYLLSLVIAGAFMGQQSLAMLAGPLGLLLGCLVLRALLIVGQQRASHAAASRIKQTIRERLFAHWTGTGPALLHRERTGELAAVYAEGLDKIEVYFSRYLPRLLQVAVIPLTIAVVAGLIDRLSGLILLLTAPIIPVFMNLIGSLATQRAQRQWTVMSRMSAHFLDVLQGLATLKLFGRSDAQAEEIRRISQRYRLTTMSVLRVAFLSALVLELAASLSTAIVAVQIGVRLVEGYITFQPGLFVLLLAPEFYLPFRQLGTDYHAAMEGNAAADRLHALLNEPVLPAPLVCSPVPPSPFDVVFEEVSFCYPGRARPALAGVSGVLHGGQTTALVGPSGAGKSTLLQLLMRYLDPGAGRIRVGDTELTAMDRAAWRGCVAVVPQFPVLFSGSVRENLLWARPDAQPDDVEAAARSAGAHDFIVGLPHGYDTRLGEQGWRLSGGERQRLAIARAFLKQAPVLLMDEPGANLDPESEEAMAAATARLMAGRLVVVIAHRLRTVMGADQIWVLEQGRLVEVGTHGSLLARPGAYANLIGGTA
jgi:thiol reductant ABC exporter CydD subunit